MHRIQTPKSYTNNTKIDLAGNAFCGYVVSAVCLSLMGFVDWDVAVSARGRPCDSDEGEDGAEEEAAESEESADNEGHEEGEEEW